MYHVGTVHKLRNVIFGILLSPPFCVTVFAYTYNMDNKAVSLKLTPW